MGAFYETSVDGEDCWCGSITVYLACIVASICFLQERFMHEKPGCILTAGRIRNSFMAKSHGYKHGHAPPVRAAFANYSLHRAALTQQTYVLALHTISPSSSSAAEGMFWVLSVVCMECCYYHCCHSSRERIATLQTPCLQTVIPAILTFQV